MINHLGQITKFKKKKKTKKKKKKKEKKKKKKKRKTKTKQKKTHMDLIFNFPKNQRILILQVVIGYN
jgi:hypothetical protein